MYISSGIVLLEDYKDSRKIYLHTNTLVPLFFDTFLNQKPRHCRNTTNERPLLDTWGVHHLVYLLDKNIFTSTRREVSA